MKDSLAKAMDDLLSVAESEVGNDNQAVLSFEEIKAQAEALTNTSNENDVAGVVKAMFFADIGGLQLGSLISLISGRTGYGKNDIKQELKKLREQHALHPADPALAVVAQFLKDRYSEGEHLRFAKDGLFWAFRKTHFEPLSERELWAELVHTTKKMYVASKGNVKAIAGNARDLLIAEVCNQHGVFDPFGEPKPVISCQNGELWLNADGTFELRPHSPDSGQTYCLPADFNADADCPEFKHALDGIFAQASDPDGMVRHLMELFGYALQPKRDLPLYAVFFGAGRNGKTNLAFTLLKLIGRDGYYVDRVHKLESSRFTIAHLAGKRVFLDDDVEADIRLPDGLLKTISEGKEMSGEHKFKDRFMFVCRVVPILLCNKYPNLTDLSVGMQRRAMVIPFARTFTPEEVDRELFERIQKNELSGVLNMALAGLKRLRKRGEFLLPVDVVEANKDWFAQCSSLAAFMRQQCQHGAAYKMKVAELYSAYEIWTDGQGFKHVTSRYKMKSELKALGYTVKDIAGFPYVMGAKYQTGTTMFMGTANITSDEHEEACSKL